MDESTEKKVPFLDNAKAQAAKFKGAKKYAVPAAIGVGLSFFGAPLLLAAGAAVAANFVLNRKPKGKWEGTTSTQYTDVKGRKWIRDSSSTSEKVVFSTTLQDNSKVTVSAPNGSTEDQFGHLMDAA